MGAWRHMRSWAPLGAARGLLLANRSAGAAGQQTAARPLFLIEPLLPILSYKLMGKLWVVSPAHSQG